MKQNNLYTNFKWRKKKHFIDKTWKCSNKRVVIKKINEFLYTRRGVRRISYKIRGKSSRDCTVYYFYNIHQKRDPQRRTKAL